MDIDDRDIDRNNQRNAKKGNGIPPLRRKCTEYRMGNLIRPGWGNLVRGVVLKLSPNRHGRVLYQNRAGVKYLFNPPEYTAGRTNLKLASSILIAAELWVRTRPDVYYTLTHLDQANREKDARCDTDRWADAAPDEDDFGRCVRMTYGST